VLLHLVEAVQFFRRLRRRISFLARFAAMVNNQVENFDPVR